MGSSIRSYLWPCCGVFHQIPTLAGVLTSLDKGYKGSSGPVLCLHLSCLFLLLAALLVYLLWLVADHQGNVCLFTVCDHVVHLHLSMIISAFVHLSSSGCVPRLLNMCHTYILPFPCTWHVHTDIHVYFVTLCVRVIVGDLVAEAARGGLLTLSHSRGASSSPAHRKQTS